MPWRPQSWQHAVVLLVLLLLVLMLVLVGLVLLALVLLVMLWMPVARAGHDTGSSAAR